MDVLEFAIILREAADLNEKSWNGKRYETSIEHAAESVCTRRRLPDLTQPVYFLLRYCWNDALDWADNIVLKTARGR